MQSHICHVRTAYRRLPLGGKLSRKRLMRGDQSALMKGTLPTRPTHKSSAIAALFAATHLPTHQNFPVRQPQPESEKSLYPLCGGCRAGKFGEGQGGLEGRETPPKGVSSPSKVFLPLQQKSTPPRQNAATGCGLNPHGSTRCFHSFVFGCRRRAVLRRTVSEPSSVAARSLVIR